jgi:hypothetical protein
MDEQMWTLLHRNLTGITDVEADGRPHLDANSVRWMVGHLAWFEEWAHDAIGNEGRFLVDRPSPSFSRALPDTCSRCATCAVPGAVHLAR